MALKIDKSVLEKFPGVKLAVIQLSDANNKDMPETLGKLIQEECEAIQRMVSLETLMQHPLIDQWRQAYKAFGANPKTFKCSVEALLRRVIKQGSLPRINTIVDCYNLTSVKFMLPAGSDDDRKVTGDVFLTIADGSELFVSLGTSKEESVVAGEVIYRDDSDVLCRRWNWRECEKSKLTKDTTHATLVLEGLENASSQLLTSAAEFLMDLLRKYTGGNCSFELLDGSKTETKLS